ncbi:hypothetical protein SH501x_003202 [Pirellulaceae bacterium SH501]
MKTPSTVAGETVFAIAAVFIVIWQAGGFEGCESKSQAQQQGQASSLVLLAKAEPRIPSIFKSNWNSNGQPSRILLPASNSNDWWIAEYTSASNPKIDINVKLSPESLPPDVHLQADATAAITEPVPFSKSLPPPIAGSDPDAQNNADNTRDFVLEYCKSCFTFQKMKDSGTGDLTSFLRGIADLIDNLDNKLAARENDADRLDTEFEQLTVGSRCLGWLQHFYAINRNGFLSAYNALDVSKRKLFEQKLFLSESTGFNFEDALKRLKSSKNSKFWQDICYGYIHGGDSMPSGLFDSDNKLVEWLNGVKQDDSLRYQCKFYPENLLFLCCRLAAINKLPNKLATSYIIEQCLQRLRSYPNGAVALCFAELGDVANRKIEFDVTIVIAADKQLIVKGILELPLSAFGESRMPIQIGAVSHENQTISFAPANNLKISRNADGN